jgi:hypothetical protein
MTAHLATGGRLAPDSIIYKRRGAFSGVEQNSVTGSFAPLKEEKETNNETNTT